MTPTKTCSFFARNFSNYYPLSLPKPPSLSVLADNCTSLHQLKQVHAQMILTSRIHDNYAVSRLLSFSALSNCGDLHYAIKIFRYTQEPNTFMWNTMIRALAGSNNPSGALFLYRDMRRLGILPGKHTFPFVLKACANCKAIVYCKQVHKHTSVLGLDSDLHVVNGLVRGYAMCDELGDARHVFDEMRGDRNLSIWTSMICGYAQNDCSNEALVLFNRMVAEGFEPNGATLASVLSACARQGCLELGDQIYEFWTKKGIGYGVILGTALVHMYAQNGAISKAINLFEAMPEKNIATWNALIHGLGVHGHGEEALSVFHRLQKEEIIKPNHITFVGVLSACCHAGLVEQGKEILQSMKTVYDIEPKIEHYGCMVDLLGRAGRLLDAEKLIADMPWKADVMIWGALLTACRNCGDIEIAERVVQKILALEPGNHGVHVVLSNMYSEAGRWEDVVRLREVMKHGNLKKIPGWSLVDDTS